MGFGKYTKEERKIVEEINFLLKQRYWHTKRVCELSDRIDLLISQLGGKYRKRANK